MEKELNFNKWESAIGRLILSCSRVEYELIRLYEKWLPNRTYHSDSYLSRYDKAIGVAKESLNQGEQIASMLIQMRKFAHLRHMVAHNPIHYSTETETWHIFDLKDNKDSIDLQSLLDVSEKIYKLSTLLSYLLRVNI